MEIDPISAGVGILSGGLGIFQGLAQSAAEKQRYVNEVAFQNATSKFNKWQAGFNAKATDATAQFRYYTEVVNYNQQLAYTSQLRNYDLSQEIAQAKKVEETRVGAAVDYMVNSKALSDKFAEEGMARAVAAQQYLYRVMQQSSAFQAAAQEGASSDRIVNNFTRQVGDYETLQKINTDLSKRQYSRDQLSRVTQYLSQYNSQDFFKAQERWDPIAPYPPLSSMVMPPPPSMTGAAPSGNAGLNIATGILGGANAYMSTASALGKL